MLPSVTRGLCEGPKIKCFPNFHKISPKDVSFHLQATPSIGQMNLTSIYMTEADS
jgi:hypothetical protein